MPPPEKRMLSGRNTRATTRLELGEAQTPNTSKTAVGVPAQRINGITPQALLMNPPPKVIGHSNDLSAIHVSHESVAANGKQMIQRNTFIAHAAGTGTDLRRSRMMVSEVSSSASAS